MWKDLDYIEKIKKSCFHAIVWFLLDVFFIPFTVYVTFLFVTCLKVRKEAAEAVEKEAKDKHEKEWEGMCAFID